MTREGKRSLAAFAVLLAAAALAACGGSDSDSTSSSSRAVEATSGVQEDDGDQDGSRAQKGSGAQKGTGNRAEAVEGKQSKGQAESGEPSGKAVTTPLEVSGGGSGQFRVEGGDNSIADYGEESAESELREVAEIVHGFFTARVEGRWQAACSYLARANAEKLEQLVSESPELRNASCAQALKAFTRPLPATLQRQLTTVDAGSFRHDGEQGFLLYYGAGEDHYAMPLVAEGDTWKVAGLSATLVG